MKTFIKFMLVCIGSGFVCFCVVFTLSGGKVDSLPRSILSASLTGVICTALVYFAGKREQNKLN